MLPYTNDDLIVARKLIDAGAAAVMPLGAPIGSGMGIQNVTNLRILRERITEVPLIVDAGVGTASDAALAMELGADGVLMNTAIAEAQDAVLMAEAMGSAVDAGRKAFHGRADREEAIRFGFEPAARSREVTCLFATASRVGVALPMRRLSGTRCATECPPARARSRSEIAIPF